MNKPNILFVLHAASRTGAPIVLLHFLKWLKASTGARFTTLIMESGELDNEFAALSSVVFWNEETYYTSLPRRATSRLNKLIHDKPLYQPFPKKLASEKFDLIYLNTVASNTMAPMLKEIFGCPVLCHVHENEFTINNHYPQCLNESTKNSIDHYIAVSESTKQNLLEAHKIPEEKISVCYEFVPIANMGKVTKSAAQMKQELNLKDEYIVGGSGLTTWRKGIDLFIQLAQRLNALDLHNNIKLVWVGAEEPVFKCQKDYELKRLGLADKIIFTGSQKEPNNFFQLFNVFALTSREDPFPLVCLEAASLGVPIFCFHQSGGMSELIEKGGGKTFPYLDVDAMAKGILHCVQNRELERQMGGEAKKLVQQYDVDKISPQILEVISRL